MKFLNHSMEEIIKKNKAKKVIFFGNGSWVDMVNHTDLMQLSENFAYIIDNNSTGTRKIGEITLSIYKPYKLLEERDCIVILTSPIYMYDMYCQLEEMRLPDSIICYSFPFIQMVSNKKESNGLNYKKNDGIERIPKIIHSFWFSGDEKPYEYKKCVDTWSAVLPDYKIIEWNMDNYDWQKHPFVKRAIELKTWAYASDFARLDVLRQYGGIYLDMDVEVFKTFDELLCNKAILSFANNVNIDLAVVGAEKGNPLIDELIGVYDTLELPNEKKDFIKYFQPFLVRDILVKNGVRMDGTFQVIRDATVFPKEYFMPMDAILYKDYEKTDHTYCVHYDNFGWSFGPDNKKEKKKKDNNILWEMLNK